MKRQQIAAQESAISLNLLPRCFHSVSPHQDTSAHLLCRQLAYRHELDSSCSGYLELHPSWCCIYPAGADMWCHHISWSLSAAARKEKASCYAFFHLLKKTFGNLSARLKAVWTQPKAAVSLWMWNFKISPQLQKYCLIYNTAIIGSIQGNNVVHSIDFHFIHSQSYFSGAVK